MTEKDQFITKIAGKFAFSSSGKVYYWGAYEPNAQIGFIKSIYPILIESISIPKPKFYSNPYINEYIPFELDDKQIGFLENNHFKLSNQLKPFTINRSKEVSINKIDCDWNSLAILLSDQQIIFGKTRKGKYSSSDHYIPFDPKLRFENKPIDVAVSDTNHGSNYVVLCEENQLLLFGEYISHTLIEDYKDDKSIITLNLPRKNVFMKVTFFNDQLILTDINQHHFIFEKIKGHKDKINLKPFINYEILQEKLSPINYPALNYKYVLNQNNELYQINENNAVNKINFPLNSNEKILDIQLIENPYGSHPPILVLTDQGRLFGLGNNSNFELKNGDRSDKPFDSATVLNHYLGMETRLEDVQRLMKTHQYSSNFLHQFDHFIPQEFLENDDVLLFKAIANNFPTFDMPLYPKEKILKFIQQLPEKSIDLLHLNLEAFKDPKEIETMSKYIPEFILLFHDRISGYDLPLETFLNYMKPIMYKSDGSLKTFKELFSARERAFNLYELTDNLNQLSNNFLMALISFGVKFDFISYPYLLKAGFAYGMRTDVPKEVLLKIQEDCTLAGEIKLTQNDQIKALLKNDYVSLAIRLIQSNIIPKSKFTSLYAKSPEKFSLRFRSILLGTKPEPPKNKQSGDLKIDDQSFIEVYSYSSRTVMKIKGNYYYMGNVTHSNFTGIKYHAKTPFLLTSYINSIHGQSDLLFLTAFEDSFTYVFKDNRIFVEGILASVIREIQGEASSENFIEVTQWIHLKNDESIQKIIMNGIDHSPIMLTTSHRILLLIKDNNYDLFTNKEATREISQVDVTPYHLLSQGEYFTHISTSSNRYFFVVTSKGNIYFKTKDSKNFSSIKLPNSNETTLALKENEVGVVVMTNQNNLWYSGLRLNGTKVIPWNKSVDYSEHEKAPDYPMFDFELMQFPLKKEEKIINFDVGKKHALAISNQGKVFLWGDNDFGALGTNRAKITNQLDLSFLKKGEFVVRGFAGDDRTYLMTSLQRVFAFGNNQSFSLGDGTATNRYQPVDLTKKFKG